MLKQVLAFTTALTCVAGVALAAPTTKTAKPTAAKKPAKLTEVKYCPITGEEVKGKGDGSEVVGKYNVHFCCAGCKPAFDKLSTADKQKKIAELLKKQNSKKPA